MGMKERPRQRFKEHPAAAPAPTHGHFTGAFTPVTGVGKHPVSASKSVCTKRRGGGGGGHGPIHISLELNFQICPSVTAAHEAFLQALRHKT